MANQRIHPQRLQAGLTLEGQWLSLEDLRGVSTGECRLAVSRDPEMIRRMTASFDQVQQAVREGWRVYGITSGFGSMANVPVPPEQAGALQANLLSFLATGTGQPVQPSQVRVAMALRANMLLRGASGVRLEIVERLVHFLNAGACPVVAEFGSIGASGDLVPLAAVARAITGQGSACRVWLDGREMDGLEALTQLGLEPLELYPKEALAIVNGTTFSAAIAANAVSGACDLFALALGCHALMIKALVGHEEPFLPFVHACKPHPGQIWVARIMRELLGIPDSGSAEPGTASHVHLQDRYSVRCLPQYLGPIAEGLRRIRETVEVEMNAITDNPLIDGDAGRFYQSGNFLGQYLGVAMDDLRRDLGLLAKHLDVQIAQLVEPAFNHGLPASLHGNGERSFNMGLKGLQITGNSIMPMLVFLGNPLVSHFPTHAEQYNQNINGLSWGSAHLASQSVDMAVHYLSVSLIFAVQAVDLRTFANSGHYDGRTLLPAAARPLYEAVHAVLGRRPGPEAPLIYNDADCSIEVFLRQLGDSIRGRKEVVKAIEPILLAMQDRAGGEQSS